MVMENKSLLCEITPSSASQRLSILREYFINAEISPGSHTIELKESLWTTDVIAASPLNFKAEPMCGRCDCDFNVISLCSCTVSCSRTYRLRSSPLYPLNFY